MDVDRTTAPVASPAQRAGATRGTTVANECATPGLPGSMSSLAGTRTLKTAGMTGCVGGCLAVLGFWRTGLIAAVPAATGLTALAASDLTTHRFSLKTLRLATALVVVGLVDDSLHSSDWDRLLASGAMAGVVAVTVLALWLNTAGIAFGDVLLFTFAVLIPAWLSPWAAVTTVLIALVVGGATAMIQRHGRSAGRSPVTVAVGPALLAGWVAAMVVG